MAIEAEIATQSGEMEDKEDDMEGPYTNEPLGDEEWTREYRRSLVEKKKRDRMLKSCLKARINRKVVRYANFCRLK